MKGHDRGPQQENHQKQINDDLKYKPTNDPVEFIEYTEKLAEVWAGASLPPTQLRKFYHEVKRIEQLLKSKGGRCLQKNGAPD